MRHRISIAIAIAIVAAALAGATGAALANETITYSYDAKGRLVKVEHSGTANNGVVANYTFDKADNRVNQTITGA